MLNKSSIVHPFFIDAAVLFCSQTYISQYLLWIVEMPSSIVIWYFLSHRSPWSTTATTTATNLLWTLIMHASTILLIICHHSGFDPGSYGLQVGMYSRQVYRIRVGAELWGGSISRSSACVGFSVFCYNNTYVTISNTNSLMTWWNVRWWVSGKHPPDP